MPNVSPHGIYVMNAGVWVPAVDVDAKNLGAWAQAKSVHARRAGVWTKVWEDNAAPNPVTGLAVGLVWNGSSAYTATAMWSNPADIDLATAEVTFTVNGVAQTPTTQVATDTDATVTVPADAVVSFSVRLQDTGGLWSTSVASSAVTAPPGAVTGVSVTAMSLAVVSLGYTSPSGATSIQVARSVNGVYGGVTSLSTTAPWWEDTIGVAASVSYLLRASSAAGLGPVTYVSGDTIMGVPSGLAMDAGYSTNHGTVGFTWARTGSGSGEAFPASVFYRIIRSSATLNTTTGLSGSFAASQDFTHTLYVRMESNYNGVTVVGSSTDTLTLNFGHASYDTTDSYYLSKTDCNIYLGHPDGPTPPGGANITITQMDVNLTCTFSTSLASGTATRTLQYLDNGAAGYPTGSKSNPWVESFAFPSTPTGGQDGIIANGSGWNSTAGGSFRLTGTIAVAGTQIVNYPAVNNTVS